MGAQLKLTEEDIGAGHRLDTRGHRQRPLPLRGRDEHVAQINTSLHAVARRGQARVLLTKDRPGSGKTRLLLEAVTLAERVGFRAVARLSTFPGPPAGPAPGEAASGADALPARRDGPGDDTGLSGRADLLLDLRKDLREALEHGPAVVALDNLHLVDTPMLLALRDLIAGLSGRPVLWFLAFGSGGLEARRQGTELFLSGLPTERVPRLSRLAGEPLVRLIADHLGAEPDEGIVELAEGVSCSPLAVIDLVRGLVDDGDVTVTDRRACLRVPQGDPTRVPGRFRVPPPVPPRFAAMIRVKLRALAPFTVNVLKLAAVLGSPFTPMDLAVMLDKTPAELLPALDEAFSRGVLVSGTNDFAFRSEPVWRVILDSVPPPMVMLLHEQAANRLLSQPGGVEAAALHLVHVVRPGDLETVRIISEATERLLGPDPATAAFLALRAMDLLKPEQEEHTRLAKTAVEALVRASDVVRAITTAEDTIRQATGRGGQLTPFQESALATLRSWLSTALLLQGKVHEASAAAGPALAAGLGDPDERDRLEAVRLAVELLTGDAVAARHAEETLSVPRRTMGAAAVGALTVQAWEHWRRGQVHEAIDLLGEACEADVGTRQVQLLHPRWMLCSILAKTGQFDKAAALAKAAGELAEPQGAALTAALMAPVQLAQGQLADAERGARAAIEGAEGLCLPVLGPPVWRVRALVGLRTGSLEEAEGHLRVIERRFPRDLSRPWWAMRFLLSAQLAHVKHGAAAALEALTEIWEGRDARRELVLEDPAAAACCVRWAMDAGASDFAKMAVGTVESLSAGTRGLDALHVGRAHARGILDGDADALAEASRSYPDPWARAMAVEDRARLLLDDDRDAAIADLGKALEIYAAMGDEWDTARVRADLRQLGVRRRYWKHAERPVSGWDSLTGAERRVAELVAEGLTNRQVANQLFVSPHTVGFHLRQVYKKLHLRSRRELIRYRA